MSEDSKKCKCNCPDKIRKQLLLSIRGSIEGTMGKLEERINQLEENSGLNLIALETLHDKLVDTMKNVGDLAIKLKKIKNKK